MAVEVAFKSLDGQADPLGQPGDQPLIKLPDVMRSGMRVHKAGQDIERCFQLFVPQGDEPFAIGPDPERHHVLFFRPRICIHPAQNGHETELSVKGPRPAFRRQQGFRRDLAQSAAFDDPGSHAWRVLVQMNPESRVAVTPGFDLGPSYRGRGAVAVDDARELHAIDFNQIKWFRVTVSAQ